MSTGAKLGARRRRPIKVRPGSLGPLLCWGVVFADIGTSVYYTPGILFPQFHGEAAIFVAATLVVFFLLAIKYAEVTWRYPEGGGVVTVATRALHPFVGVLGGLFILVDYYLTAALSALSGVIYLSIIFPGLKPAVVGATILALAVLGALNLVGIRESARASLVFAGLAAAGQFVTVIGVVVKLGPEATLRSFQALTHGPHLTPLYLITGYAAAFLAFSGLESIAQLAPAMREPRRRVANRAMVIVAISIALTSPLLTLWSTTLLGDYSKLDPNQFISILGGYAAGPILAYGVAVSGSLLLIFASNTAIIGSYHVFLALSRMGFLPRAVESVNRWRKTPHVAIGLAVGIPIALVFIANGAVAILGDLYAFGLLGAFCVTCAALDVVRWRERSTWKGLRTRVVFGLGLFTTVAVVVAWSTNLVAKPAATLFGGGITVAGLVIAFTTYSVNHRRGRPIILPFLHHAGTDVAPLGVRANLGTASVLAIIPNDPEGADAVIREALLVAEGRPILFLHRGNVLPTGHERLLEITDPYLRDRTAQGCFAQAERLARKAQANRRYVYIPGNLRAEAVGDVWRQVWPKETIIVDGDQGLVPPLAFDRIRRAYVDGITVLRYVTGRLAHTPGLAG